MVYQISDSRIVNQIAFVDERMECYADEDVIDRDEYGADNTHIDLTIDDPPFPDELMSDGPIDLTADDPTDIADDAIALSDDSDISMLPPKESSLCNLVSWVSVLTFLKTIVGIYVIQF